MLNKWWFIGLAFGILCFLGGLWCGVKHQAAPEIRETEKIVYKDRVVTVEHTSTVKAEAEVKRVVIYRDRVTQANGQITEHEVERDDTSIQAHEQASTDTHREETQQLATDRVVSPAEPVWHVGVLVVASSREFQLRDPVRALQAGAYAGRHLIGPFSIGLSAVVPVAQPVSLPTLTLSLSAGF